LLLLLVLEAHGGAELLELLLVEQNTPAALHRDLVLLLLFQLLCIRDFQEALNAEGVVSVDVVLGVFADEALFDFDRAVVLAVPSDDGVVFAVKDNPLDNLLVSDHHRLYY
jgi:hypothetical protein